MILYCLEADEQLVGYLLVTQSVAYLPDYISLPW